MKELSICQPIWNGYLLNFTKIQNRLKYNTCNSQNTAIMAILLAMQKNIKLIINE